MRRRWLLAAALAVGACGELSSPRGTLRLDIVPVFDASGAFADNADQLRVQVRRASDSVLIKDTVLAIDPSTGSADGTLSVLILSNPQQMIIALQAVRSADGAVLFSGQSIVSLSTGSGSGGSSSVEIPVTYAGPKGAKVQIAPRDTSVPAGATFALRATVTDSVGQAVAAPVTFSLVNPADSVTLRVGRVNGVAVAAAGANATVFVFASSPDNLRDTTTVSVGSSPVIPVASVTVSPSSVPSLAVTATAQLTATTLDAAGNTLTGRTVTWSSSASGVATVSATGLVTAVAVGSATITATSEGKNGTAAITVTPAPAAVKVTPGIAAVSVGATTPLAGVVVDGAGATIGSIPVSWTSRATGTATVNSSGVVTGVAAGTAVIVAQGGGFADSTRVVVPPAGNVVASTTAGAGARTFQVQKVGDTLTVTLTTDMRFTPNEKLGAYDATLTWGAALMQFIDVQPGPVFAAPVVNANGASTGTLQLSGADASSNAVGQLVIAKVRFKALAQGTATPTITFKDMSGQLQGGSSTVLDSRITVINGTITIVP